MRAIAAAAVLLLVAACQAPPAEMTEAEIAAIQAEVTVVGDQMMTAFSNLSPDAVKALYDPSTMDGNDGTVYYANYDEWVTHLQDMFGRFEEADGGWTNTRVDVLAPDVALLVGQNSLDVTQTSGVRSNIHGFITLVLKKIDGDWKVIHQASVGRWTAIEEG